MPVSQTEYTINKNINKPIEFKGLKAHYIGWLGAGLVILLLLFAILYCIGLNSFICLGIAGAGGCFLFFYVYHLSKKFGEHGMMKAIARRRVPKVLKNFSRAVFLNLVK
jgi:hypothetical protein